MKSWLLRLHYFLLPQEKRLGYMPYVWLGYLLIYFFNYVFRTPETEEIIATVIGVTLFLMLYFSTFRRKKAGIIIHIIAIHGIGAVLALWNLGASVFFVYAACFCAYLDNVRQGFIGIVLIALLVALQAWLMDLPSYFYLPGIFFSVLIGSSNLFFAQMERKNELLRQSQEEIKQLATTAERERIARDLHDLIGHTFSLLTKKAELAQKLLDKSPELVRNELKDIETTSREALAQVREAVSGYRKLEFHEELIATRGLCKASDIKLDEKIETIELPQQINQSFAYCLKEAMTNVVRHSNATQCDVSLSRSNGSFRLCISDNGGVSAIKEGNGLTGMRERVQQLGGSLSVSHNKGLQLNIEVPAQ